jgi:NADPH2:quinone reductase
VVAHLGAASAGYAELAVREVRHLHELPDDVAEDVAVAMIGTGRTAMAILDTARIEPGDVVLVTAAAGDLVPLLTRFPLAEAAAAHAALESRDTVGKVVLMVSQAKMGV